MARASDEIRSATFRSCFSGAIAARAAAKIHKDKGPVPRSGPSPHAPAPARLLEPVAGTDTKEMQLVLESSLVSVLIEQVHVPNVVEHPTPHPPPPACFGTRTHVRPLAYKIEFKWGQDLLKGRSLMTHLMARITHRSHFRANWSSCTASLGCEMACRYPTA